MLRGRTKESPGKKLPLVCVLNNKLCLNTLQRSEQARGCWMKQEEGAFQATDIHKNIYIKQHLSEEPQGIAPSFILFIFLRFKNIRSDMRQFQPNL